MKLNVSVSLSQGKKPVVKCNKSNFTMSSDNSKINKCIELLAQNIDEVKEAVLHLAKTSVVKPTQQEAECNSCCEQKQDKLAEVELDHYDKVKIVNQNLMVLNGHKFKVVEAFDKDDNLTKKLKNAVKFRGFWKD